MAERNIQLSFWENFFLGGIAAGVSKTVAAPLERVKLMIQNEAEMIKSGSLPRSYGGFVGCVKYTYTNEGVYPFWRGNLANVIRYFPTQALNFSILGKLSQVFPTHPDDPMSKKLYVNVTSGGIAGSTSLLFVYSLDYARTRLANDILQSKIGGQRKFMGLTDVYLKTLKSDGLHGLYRGFGVSCCGIFVYRGLYFGLYNTFKPYINQNKGNLIMTFLLAYCVTVIGETVTYPIDTVRRRMMMSSLEKTPYRSSFDCISQIFAKEGTHAFFKGAGANVLRGFAGALLLSGFDKIKEGYTKYIRQC